MASNEVAGIIEWNACSQHSNGRFAERIFFYKIIRSNSPAAIDRSAGSSLEFRTRSIVSIDVFTMREIIILVIFVIRNPLLIFSAFIRALDRTTGWSIVARNGQTHGAAIGK